MSAILRLQPRLVPIAGTVVLVAVAWYDPSWSLHHGLRGVAATLGDLARKLASVQ